MGSGRIMKSLPLTAKRCPATTATCARSCSLQAYRTIGTMVQMTLAQPLVAPQRVALRTQHRSMAATPMVVRATRQTRVARCAAFAAADTTKVRSRSMASPKSKSEVWF